MHQVVHPASGPLEGSVRLPGDKSISHRYAMLAAAAEGVSTIANYSSGADCHSTLRCVEALGARVSLNGRDVTIEGRGLEWAAPSADLDAGNSGSTIRMLSGFLAGQPFTSRLIGDESLSQRPMQRIIAPLSQMGASLTARDGKFPPITISGGALQPIDYTLPVPSAQVKSCILFAGLFANGITTVRESAPTRDHSEVALREFGATLEKGPGFVSIHGRPALQPQQLAVPGDLSSAAFFLVAASIVPGSRLILQSVGLNPTRASLIDFLVSMGAQIKILDISMRHGEPVGDLLVQAAPLSGGSIEGKITAALIDEIPVLAVLGACSEKGLLVKDAAELRIKETDRIETTANNLRRLGVPVETFPDGFHVPGRQQLRSAEVDSCGDHRIAMACAVAALRADGPVTIANSDAASVSFPEFWDTLAQVRG